MAKKTKNTKIIAPDKKKHIVVNFIGVLMLSLLFNAPIGALIIMIGVSFGKEIYDTYKKHPTGFSFADLLADIVGMIIAIVVYIILVNWIV